MTVAVVVAVIGAAGTVLGAWIQGRSQRRAGGNIPSPEEQVVSGVPGRDVTSALSRDLPLDDC
jgi:hypothetical protein